MTIKILVADDSANIQRIVSLAFSDEDAIVESVSDGGTALDVVRDFGPDVVLADVFLPGCSGYEICARIKEDAELADTAVVLLAGTFEPYDESEASRAKCNGFLTKPFNTEDLLRTVQSLAEERQKARNAGGENLSTDKDIQTQAAEGAGPKTYRLHNLVSPAVRDSFLGADRVLDLFDSDQLSAAQTALTASIRKAEYLSMQSGSFSGIPPAIDVAFSENTMNRIVDTVLRRMSAEAIREVAWEVVPELSESIIRRTIEEQSKP